MNEWITPLWGFLTTVGLLVWLHRREHRSEVIDLLPVCACSKPNTPGSHGPDWCDWGSSDPAW